MPASNINLYHMQDARNNFDATRPAPICADANQFMGQCQNIHISRNCYYGYHNLKNSEYNHVTTDCEMLEAPHTDHINSLQSNNRKRSADDGEYPQNKRFREEVQKKKRNIEPETNETMGLDKKKEDMLEILYWNTHGGNIYHLEQCL